MLISSALAQQATTAAAQPSPLASLIPIVLMFVIFYFLIIRPQQKRMRAHQQMVGGIKKGDAVITAGGIHGTVVKVDADPDSIHVEIAPGVKVRVVRSTITTVLNASAAKTAEVKPLKNKAEKSEPAKNDTESADAEEVTERTANDNRA
jgi:preprotein translocase subunit YajC